MTERDTQKRREILRSFMESRNLNPKRWAERAGVSPQTIYNFLNGHSASITAAVYAKLAAVEGVPVFVLDGTTEVVRLSEVVTVVGAVQAGAWGQSSEWDEAMNYGVSAPIPAQMRGKLHGLEVRGRSMDLVYPEGSIALVIGIYDMDRDLKSGDRVVVKRTRADGMVENTIKELVIDESDQAWLWPRSSDPRFQAPIPLTNGRDGVETVEVVAVVVRAVLAEPNFS